MLHTPAASAVSNNSGDTTSSNTIQNELQFLASFHDILSTLREKLLAEIQEMEKDHHHGGAQLFEAFLLLVSSMQNSYGIRIEGQKVVMDVMDGIKNDFSQGMDIMRQMKDWDVTDPWSKDQIAENDQFVQIMNTKDGSVLSALREINKDGFLGQSTLGTIEDSIKGLKPASIPEWDQYAYYANFIMNNHTTESSNQLKNVEDQSGQVMESISGFNNQVNEKMKYLLSSHTTLQNSAMKILSTMQGIGDTSTRHTGQAN